MLFIITGKVTTLEPIHGTIFADHGVFVLGGDQQVFDGAITLEVGLYAIPPTDLFNALTETLCIRYNYMTLGFDLFGSGLGICGALAVSPTTDLTGRPVKHFPHLVQSHFGVFTLGQCLPEKLHFLWRRSGLLQTVLALWVRVLITLNLAERWCWLSHCRYWSM